MKDTIFVIAIALLFFVAGYSLAEIKTAQLSPNQARVTLVMYDSQGRPVSREYQGIVSWAYNVVQGQPQMQLGFMNDTAYRCGFEP